MRKILSSAMAAGLACLATLQPSFALTQPATWSEPTAPFAILDNLYYVGTRGLGAYLIVSDGKAILLDGTLAENVGAIEDNIRSLGFKLEDVKIILNSHAHFDHAAGIAGLKTDTGAQLMAMAEDKNALEHGRHDGDANYIGTFPAVKVDRTLPDGDVVALGDIEMKATLTPGHTKGCTTWSIDLRDGAVTRHVVFPCSLSVAGNKLVGNKSYPTIVEDYRKSFERLDAMRADIVLPAHPELGDIFERKAKFETGDKQAYVDTGLLDRLVENARAAFEKELKAANR